MSKLITKNKGRRSVAPALLFVVALLLAVLASVLENYSPSYSARVEVFAGIGMFYSAVWIYYRRKSGWKDISKSDYTDRTSTFFDCWNVSEGSGEKIQKFSILKVLGLIVILTMFFYVINNIFIHKFNGGECIKSRDDGHIWHINRYVSGVYYVAAWVDGHWGSEVSLNKSLVENTKSTAVVVYKIIDCPSGLLN